ncbi:MAG: hypothetical protein FWE10_08655 [Rikenellaceae bacterium]|nr:hypothetical protein [Rikenellaceae bacterium]MCL2692686.1 hypothetical protein [Rikenellaceae bacterium]
MNNWLNLVREVRTGSASGALKARYVWSSDGTKLRVRDGAGVDGFDYLGSLTYSSNVSGVLSLETAQFAGGVIRLTSGVQEVNYFLTDHLGSVRSIVDAAGDEKTVARFLFGASETGWHMFCLFENKCSSQEHRNRMEQMIKTHHSYSDEAVNREIAEMRAKGWTVRQFVYSSELVNDKLRSCLILLYERPLKE